MLDSLDAAFASKKPKVVPATSKSAPKKSMQPKANKANKSTNSALHLKLNHQAKAREAVKQSDRKQKDAPNPLYSKVDGLLYTTKTANNKSRPPLKELEEQLLALALASQRPPGNTKDESLLDKVKNKILQLDNPHKAKPTAQSAATSCFPKDSTTSFEFGVAGMVFRVNGDDFRSRSY
ncbi:hypothetical protein DYB32_000697 [Aphanomyces invadans]|uniref:Uncharacterized protein n=1 Tax=Aphanomyces invadans TaxID=157072 RepID=A0A418B974_9STRA|nr:hypothetical protein DYB32_000697 [Aphanomyces invadans]